jgi:hypothetical protein
MAMTTRNLIPPYFPLYQKLDDGQLGGGAAWNNSISRRSFLKRTGGATAATLVAWHSLQSTARATETPSGGGSGTRTEIKYKFVVTATPDETNPEQVETGWKNKKIPATGDHPANTIKAGPWDSGINEFYGLYAFTGSGPAKGETTSITMGGTANGKLFEDDWGDGEGNWYADDDDLEAVAEASLSGRTWTINEDTGAITAPIQVLSNENNASPGSGTAKVEVSLGQVIGRVTLDYSFVSGWSGSAGGSVEGGEGGAGADYEQTSARETVFGFVWRIKVRKTTKVFDSAGNLLSTTSTDSDP